MCPIIDSLYLKNELYKTRNEAARMSSARAYTPALGLRVLTPLYDTAIALLTRESIWRSALVRAIGLKAGERILDVGCGTGSLGVLLAKQVPGSGVIGIDPDPDVLRQARAKASRHGVNVGFHEGFLSKAFLESHAPFDVITSSLVLHQVPLEEKYEILTMIRTGLKPGGRICIADYGLQRTPLMRFLFRRTVQTLDGVAGTQLNAEGLLPVIIRRAGFANADEVKVIPTPTGSISIYLGRTDC